MKIKILKIGALLFSLSLMIFFVINYQPTPQTPSNQPKKGETFFSGSKTTFKDGREFQAIVSGPYDSAIEETPLFQFKLDEKAELSLNMGKMPQLSEGDQKEFDAKIGKRPETLVVEIVGEMSWQFKLGEKVFSLKKELGKFNVYEVPVATSSENTSPVTEQKK